jgi:hypothetical protein
MDSSKKADDGKTGFIGQRKIKAIATNVAKGRPVTRWIPILESQTDPCNEALKGSFLCLLVSSRKTLYHVIHPKRVNQAL